MDDFAACKCPACGKLGTPGAHFCFRCGSAIACPACGRGMLAGSRFCGACGEKLVRPRRGNGARQSDFVHAPAERRQLTTLFCDVVGSTSLAVTLDPEDFHELVRDYYVRCANTIHRFDGRIANFSGDGLLAVFGYPMAHEDAPERAVYAALALLTHSRASGSGLAAPLLRIGIATGEVVVGDNEGAMAEPPEIAVVGEAPFLAARLQAAAAPNTILIGAVTRQLLRNLFRLQEVMPGALKGFGEAVPAWQVLGEIDHASRFEAQGGTPTAFVGRAQEATMLAECWRLAQRGEGQIVLIKAEAGVGKSRLVDELCRQHADLALGATRFQCSPRHAASVLYPLITYTSRAARVAPSDTPELWTGKLRAMAPAMDDASIALLAALLDLPPDPALPELDPDPERRKAQTLSLLVRQAEDVAAQRPLLVFLEDAHWADPTTLEYLGMMVARVPAMRCLLVVTYRPEFVPPWSRAPRVTTLALDRLLPDACQKMISAIAGKPLPSALREQIIARTDGVPLFVEELTKALLESDLLRDEGGVWSLTRPPHSLAIPATLQDSLIARLDRLGGVRETAQIGAAIGREFSYQLLAAVSPLPEPALRAALARLGKAGLVFPRGRPPVARYQFKHSLVQEAAYSTLLRNRRARLHADIAAALERDLPEVAASQPELVAHHWEAAEQPPLAVPWWRQAGEVAIARSANREAVQHLTHAAALVAKTRAIPERDAVELAIRIRLSGPLIATNGYTAPLVADNYARASVLAAEADEDKTVFPVLYGDWVIPYVRGDIAAALGHARRFLDRAQRQDDHGLLLMGHRILGSTQVIAGEVVAGAANLERALDLFRAEAHDKLAFEFSQHPRVAGLANLCFALQYQGRVKAAMAAGHAAIAEAKRAGHFNSIAYSLTYVGLMALFQRDIATVHALAGELRFIAAEHQAEYWIMLARGMLGWVATQQGDRAGGLAELRLCAETLQHRDACLWVPQFLLLEAELLAEAGELNAAEALTDAVAPMIHRLGQRFYEPDLYRVRAVIQHARGDGTFAETFARAIMLAQCGGGNLHWLRAALAQARRLARDGMISAARDALAPALLLLSDEDIADVHDAGALMAGL